MKRKIIAAALAIVILFGIYAVGSGFMKSTSAYISDFSVSEDRSEMTIKISVASSAGYVRKAAVHQQQGGKLYLDCYSAFGGVNGSIGARSEFTVPLAEETEMIAIYRNAYCYEAVLIKDAGGCWQRVVRPGAQVEQQDAQ